MTVEEIRDIYSLYEENRQNNTLIKEGVVDNLLRQPMNMMLLNGEVIDTKVLNEAWRQIKKIEKATSEIADDDKFTEEANKMYKSIKSDQVYSGYFGEFFSMVILKGVNDIIVQKFS
ncbi:MAG: hypothetical protein UHN47_03450 [Lachnospiraceae bacterium]|nr:hypothetical protein [Lachnospiraceae bacterium]